MKLLSQIFAISFALTIFSSCAKEEEEKEEKTELEGNWEQACTSGARYLNMTSYENDLYTRSYVQYDETCTTKATTIRVIGKFEIGDGVAEPAGGKALDFVPSNAYYTFHTEGLLQHANGTAAGSTAICGGGWETNVEKELTAETCGENATYRTLVYPEFNSFKIDGANLFYAVNDAAGNGLSAATRAKTLDATAYIKK